MRGGGDAGDSRYSSRPTLTSAPRIAAPRLQPLTRSPLPRHRPLLSRQLLERGPRQVHGLRVVSRAAAQRLLSGLRGGPPGPLPASVAHPGGSPEPGAGAGAAFGLPGLETVPQEREVHYPHRGDRRGGLPRRGVDPVIARPLPARATATHHSFILEPAPTSRPDTASASPASGGGAGRLWGCVTSLGPEGRVQGSLLRC